MPDSFQGEKRILNFNGERFWVRGYAVSTVGFEEAQIRCYIRNQEQLAGKGSDGGGEFKKIQNVYPGSPWGF